MYKFQVSDEVVMSEDGMAEYYEEPNNPYNMLGVITDYNKAADEDGWDYVYTVIWENGRTNEYRAIDLDLLTIKFEAPTLEEAIALV